jgi:hypothetical protein
MRITLQRRSIGMKGKEEDWAGIEPLFSASRDSQPAETSGSSISGGSMCRDDKYLYIKMDFSNGKPDPAFECARMLILRQNSNSTSEREVDFVVSTRKDGSSHSIMRDSREQNNYECGSYSVGQSFIEMKFPLSKVPKYIDFSQLFNAQLVFWSAKKSSYTSQTPIINILIGNEQPIIRTLR